MELLEDSTITSFNKKFIARDKELQIIYDQLKTFDQSVSERVKECKNGGKFRLAEFLIGIRETYNTLFFNVFSIVYERKQQAENEFMKKRQNVCQKNDALEIKDKKNENTIKKLEKSGNLKDAEIVTLSKNQKRLQDQVNHLHHLLGYDINHQSFKQIVEKDNKRHRYQNIDMNEIGISEISNDVDRIKCNFSDFIHRLDLQNKQNEGVINNLHNTQILNKTKKISDPQSTEKEIKEKEMKDKETKASDIKAKDQLSPPPHPKKGFFLPRRTSTQYQKKDFFSQCSEICNEESIVIFHPITDDWQDSLIRRVGFTKYHNQFLVKNLHPLLEEEKEKISANHRNKDNSEKKTDEKNSIEQYNEYNNEENIELNVQYLGYIPAFFRRFMSIYNLENNNNPDLKMHILTLYEVENLCYAILFHSINCFNMAESHYLCYNPDINFDDISFIPLSSSSISDHQSNIFMNNILDCFLQIYSLNPTIQNHLLTFLISLFHFDEDSEILLIFSRLIVASNPSSITYHPQTYKIIQYILSLLSNSILSSPITSANRQNVQYFVSSKKAQEISSNLFSSVPDHQEATTKLLTKLQEPSSIDFEITGKISLSKFLLLICESWNSYIDRRRRTYATLLSGLNNTCDFLHFMKIVKTSLPHLDQSEYFNLYRSCIVLCPSFIANGFNTKEALDIICEKIFIFIPPNN